MENTPSDTGSIKVDNCPRSKPLNFKLDRHSFPKVKSNYNFVSSTVSEMKNSRYSDSPNSETVYSIGKKRKYSLGSHLLPRSVRFNAIVKRKKQRSSSSYSNSPVRQLLNYQAVSLTSSNVERILSIDFLDTSFNSTVDSEFSPNDSTVPSEVSGTSAFSELSANDTTVPSDCSTYEWDAAANDRSGFISGQISSKCNSTVDSTNCESFGDQEIEDTFNYNSVKEDVVPIFGGYQLIGDSQLLRFSQKILGLQRDFTLSSSGSLGLCVSGQTISDLHRRVLEKFHPVGEQAILLIGTNDLLRGTQSSGMCRGLKYLLQDLLQSAKKIIILTLPPVPLLSHNEDHWTRMNSYNEYIKSLPCKENFYGKLTVADISPLFYKSSTRLCRYSCFERWFYGGRRKDLIHINEEGFNIIKHFLLTNAL